MKLYEKTAAELGAAGALALTGSVWATRGLAWVTPNFAMISAREAGTAPVGSDISFPSLVVTDSTSVTVTERSLTLTPRLLHVPPESTT